MTKYDELCNGYKEALDRFNQYKDYCCTFTEGFFQGLTRYLGCPEDAITFFAPKDELDLSSGCQLRDGMQHYPDGFYTIYFSLTLKQPENQDIVLGVFRVKKSDNQFTVRLGMNRRDFEIIDKEDMFNAYNYIYDNILQYYQKDGFIKSAANPIGFAV